MITLGILYTVVCLSGIVGNGVALAVYLRKKKRPAPQYFIIGLAVIDLFVCLVIMPYGIIAVIYPSVLIVELCKLLSWLWHASISSSTFITAAIAVDRYFAVCRPLTFRVGPSYARIVILTSMIVSLLLCAPVIFQFGIAYTADIDNVTNVTSISKECTAIDPGYFGINILSAVIFLALVTLSGLSYGSVYAALRKRSKIGVAFQAGGREVSSTIVDNASGSVTDNVSAIAPEKPAKNKLHPHVMTRTPKVSGENIEDIRADIVNSTRSKKCNFCCGVQLQPQNTNTFEYSGNMNATQQGFADGMSGPAVISRRIGQQSVNPIKNKTSKMLLVVTITYIVTWMPYWSFLFLPPSFWETSTPIEIQFYNFLKYLYVINNAVNPIIYSFINKRFRSDSLALFSKCFNRFKK